MTSMFTGASIFRGNDIGFYWDVSKVTGMSSMFAGTSWFGQYIGNWNVSSVTDMSYMFERGRSFNKDIIDWNVSNVEDFSYMFFKTTAFENDRKFVTFQYVVIGLC